MTLRGILCAAALGLLASVASAQTAPAVDPAQILQTLSPEQLRAILERSGTTAAAPAAVQSERGGSNGVRASSVERDERRRALEAAEPLVPVLRAEDTVVVQLLLDFRSDDPRRPAQPATAPATAPAPQLNTQMTNLTAREFAADEALRQRRQRLVDDLTADERLKLEELVRLVGSRNPYTLDRNAQLNLPGFAPIALGGLTEEQATQRLSVEPVLLPLEVRLTRLPLAKMGVAGLKPFGYDLFDEAPSTFSPVTDVPVPADYVVGPGDQFSVQLFGSQNRTLALLVNREGTISFPELGPIRVGGLTFTAAKQTIESRVAQQMIGARANVSMADTRAIRVLVLGEAVQPGSYTVSGLATMTTALFASGGVKPIGSLRDVQLKRQGKIVRRLDLYDLLIRGDTSDDAKLLPGDVIFIPPVGSTVSVDGEVKRPAIYELRGETTVDALIQMAGGLTPEADAGRASLVHIDENGRRTVVEVNLSRSVGTGPRNGDVLQVSRLRPQLDSGVILEGFVYRPGPMAWREGMRLTDVIGSVDELKPNADQHYVLVRRETGQDRRVSVRSADLAAALAARGSTADLALQPRDRIIVFDLAPGRERIIEPLLDELRLQSDLSRPTEIVRVGGRIKVPGDYPLETGMRVSDLLRAGGNLDAGAYGGKAELARYTVNREGARQTDLIEVDLAALRAGDAAANVELRPFDFLLVKETTDWGEQESVTLKGEVRFPGVYPIRRGETLRAVIERAGGLTPRAFAKGSAFTRRDVKENEQKQLDRLTERLRSDLASMSLQAAVANQGAASQALQTGQSLLAQLQSSKAVGRMVIDLPGLMAGPVGGAKDPQLRDGDELVIPMLRQEVTVIGEVQNATSHFFSSSLKRDDYIALSGGTTRKADKRQIYVVRADGSVTAQRTSLFKRGYEAAMQPGDTVVVPLDTERMPRLPFWQAVTQIIYNLAVSVAAVNSF
jgi:protein involved in polysaccharide export with SLBB domain